MCTRGLVLKLYRPALEVAHPIQGSGVRVSRLTATIGVREATTGTVGSIVVTGSHALLHVLDVRLCGRSSSRYNVFATGYLPGSVGAVNESCPIVPIALGHKRQQI